MYIPFEELPETARVWIYQSNRSFSDAEQRKIEDALTNFISQWKSHGANLTASFKLAYNHFVVLAVDTSTNLPSGCSIDSSVAFVQEIEKAFQVSMFDRTRVALLEEGGHVVTYSLAETKKMIAEGKLRRHVMTFNNLVDTKGAWEQQWLVTAGDSWLKRFFDQLEKVV